MSREERIEREEYRREAGRDWCRVLPTGERDLWPFAEDYLRERGLDPDIARANQWYASRQAGDRELRIVIPATSNMAGNVFWQARAIVPGAEKRWQSPHAPRGDAVIVVWPADPLARTSAIVEGPMDALAAAGEGLVGLSLLGLTPPDESLRLTSKLVCGTMVLLVADSDSVGQMANVAMRLLNYGLGVRLVNPYPHKDLAEAPRGERRRILGLDAEPNCGD